MIVRRAGIAHPWPTLLSCAQPSCLQAQLTENQLGMISQMFPKHIIQYLSTEGGFLGSGAAPHPLLAAASHPGDQLSCTGDWAQETKLSDFPRHLDSANTVLVQSAPKPLPARIGALAATHRDVTLLFME
jgi:hypothetical protein